MTAAERSVAELAGAEVLEIGGHPVDEVLAAARTLMGADNPSGSLENLFALHNARLMRGLGFASESGDLEVTVRTRAGDVVRQTLHPMTGSEDATFAWRSRREMFGPPARSDSEWISASPPAHLSDRKPFSARPLPSQDAYYARMDLLDDGFMPFLESIMKEVDAQKPRRLIIDWRYNFGGDGSIVPAIAREFTKRQGSPPWRELYILTGRRTFGAGVMAVHALLGQVPLTIVGEPAGSALNQFGDATTRTYDRTGLRLHVSTLRWQLSASDDIREFIPVDVAAPFSSSDYMSGRDPAVDPILRGDEMRSVPLIALAEGSPLARQTVVERRKEFAALAWWQPPTEIELREPCQALRAAKRYADALDVCGLNAELHPYAWSSWLNLGQSQRAAGRAGSDAGLLSKGLESYRCVLRVDPGNPEADDIKSFLAAQDPDGRVAPPPDCP
ncbi:MAG TPA: hypothetical protein VFV19_16615 [Candidatus Polarisedimenticolaceae bacterium]|nr:hypothetical protein [Candidatus Polarisedimenticolaceae bacterium]